jgi:hypothetical protein
MKFVFSLLVIAVSYSSAFSQTKKTGNATTEAVCSPAVTGSNNTIHYTYCGSNPEETEKVKRLLTAINNGQDVENAKLDEVLEILTTPIKITMQVIAEDTPPGAHPRASVIFYTDDPVDRGQFEVMCDRACTPIDICRLLGSNASHLATVSDQPTVAEFLFQRQFPSLTQCNLTVESRDDKAVRIIGLTTSKRISNLVPTAVQPISSLTTEKTVMQ